MYSNHPFLGAFAVSFREGNGLFFLRGLSDGSPKVHPQHIWRMADEDVGENGTRGTLVKVVKLEQRW